jgi:hypothetical protein
MGAFRSRHRRSRRSWLIGTTLAAAAVFGVFFVAASGANLPGSTFEGNDGNLIVNTSGNTDWANVAGLNTGIDKPTGSTDNSFGQGTHEDDLDPTIVSGSIPPNKNDLTRFYEASETGANGHIYLYLGWERLVNIGNANLDFEINQHPTSGFTGDTTGTITLNRTAGDLLVNYDFGGSGTPTLGLSFWVTTGPDSQCFASGGKVPCWGNHVDLGGSSEGAVNTGTISEPLAGGTLTAGLFGEAAIDLTVAGVFPPGVCEAFGSTFVKSRASSSPTAELKDFIAPIPVNIQNCRPTTTTTGQKVVITDFARPTGFGTPTGTVDFQLFTNATCTGTPLYDSGPVNLVNGLASATTGPLTTTGTNTSATFYWLVSYSGDANNLPSTSPCGTEQTTISGNTPGVDP